MTKKIKIILLLISMSVCLGLMSSTYSRYVANTTSDINASFSKWEILVQNTDITSNGTSSITIEPIIQGNDHVADGTLAPSSKGYFDINIDPTNVDVSFNYNISLDIVDGELLPDLMITKYVIIYDGDTEEQSQVEYVVGSTISDTLYYQNKTLLDEEEPIIEEEESFSFKPFTIRVYFEWYEGDNQEMDNAEDTEICTLAVTEDVSFYMTAQISFTQYINSQN